MLHCGTFTGCCLVLPARIYFLPSSIQVSSMQPEQDKCVLRVVKRYTSTHNQNPPTKGLRGMSVGYRSLTIVSVLTILRGLFMSVASARESGVQGFQWIGPGPLRKKENVCSWQMLHNTTSNVMVQDPRLPTVYPSNNPFANGPRNSRDVCQPY